MMGGGNARHEGHNDIEYYAIFIAFLFDKLFGCRYESYKDCIWFHIQKQLHDNFKMQSDSIKRKNVLNSTFCRLLEFKLSYTM